MNFFVIESHSLVVGWSPKCACTAVADWVVNGILQPEAPIKKPRRYLLNNGFSKKPEEAANLVLNHGFKAVFFTREPMARLASAYINKFVTRKGKPLRKLERLEPFAKSFLEQIYKHANYDGPYKGISFIEFLNHIELTLAQNGNLNSHWSLQSSGITKELKQLIAEKKCFIVYQESFNKDLEQINLALGVDYIPGHKNVSQWPVTWKKPSENKNCSALTSKQIIKRKLKIGKDNLLTDNNKARIARIYEDDFELFFS